MTPEEWAKLPLQVKAAKDKAKYDRSESKVVKACLSLLHVYKIPAWRRNTGKTTIKDKYGKERHLSFGAKGAGDIEGILAPNGRHLEVECKSEHGQQTIDQKAWQQMIEQSGGIYILVRSVDDLKSFLHDYDPSRYRR